MLNLSRMKDEGVTIYAPDGTPIHLLVTDVCRGQVKLGIEAPSNYRIFRDEIDPNQISQNSKGPKCKS